VRATPNALAAELQKMTELNGPIVAMSRHLDIWAGVGLRVEMDRAEILFMNGTFLSVMLGANPIRGFGANAQELVRMFKLTAARFATSALRDDVHVDRCVRARALGPGPYRIAIALPVFSGAGNPFVVTCCGGPTPDHQRLGRALLR
jgi:hypothetical protein